MADTQPLAPTDAEIDALNDQFRWDTTEGRRDMVREVLARWGQPAHSGEPVGYLYCGGSYGDELADWEIVAEQLQCDRLNEHHGALGKEAKLPLYTAPQPVAHNIVSLSPLPNPAYNERVYGGHGNEIVHSYYTEHQMREYARQEVFRAEEAWQARAPADSVLEDSAFEAVRKNLCALPRYSFVLDDDGLVRRVQDRVGNWIEFDAAHALFDPISVDAARKQGANHD